MPAGYVVKGFSLNDQVRLIFPFGGFDHPTGNQAGQLHRGGTDLYRNGLVTGTYWWFVPTYDRLHLVTGRIVGLLSIPGTYDVQFPGMPITVQVCDEWLERVSLPTSVGGRPGTGYVTRPSGPVNKPVPDVCTCDIAISGCTCGVFAAEKAAREAADL